jgi:hypothetical protein
MVRDQRQSASSFLDHASYMFCQHFPEVRPTQVEAAAKIAKWHNDAGRHPGGHRDVYASIHATKRKGGSRMLCDVAAARQKGLWTLKSHGMEAGMIHQPIDPLSYWHVANDRAGDACLGWSRISHHGIL